MEISFTFVPINRVYITDKRREISDVSVHAVWADTRLGWGQSHLFTAKVDLEDLRELYD